MPTSAKAKRVPRAVHYRTASTEGYRRIYCITTVVPHPLYVEIVALQTTSLTFHTDNINVYQEQLDVFTTT